MEQIHKLITKDMTISEVIEKYPSTIETLLMTGVHCIGCHVSGIETLEEGSFLSSSTTKNKSGI